MNTVHASARIVAGGPAGPMIGMLLAKRGADGRYSAIAKLGEFKTEYDHHDFDISGRSGARIQRRIFFGAPLDPAFSFRS